jgi:hypothetical protein
MVDFIYWRAGDSIWKESWSSVTTRSAFLLLHGRACSVAIIIGFTPGRVHYSNHVFNAAGFQTTHRSIAKGRSVSGRATTQIKATTQEKQLTKAPSGRTKA